MSATLVDIARETRTSISTVSRVLAGGTAAARISAATRGRVMEAATRLGYRPNLVARTLRTRRSNTVALLVSDIANPWFGQVASLIERNFHRHGYSLMLCNSGEDPAREIEYLKLLPQKGIDGLILVPLNRNKKTLAEILPDGLPLVILDRPVAGIASSVSSDQEQSANVLYDALASAGVRKIALVTGPPHILTHRRRAELAAARFEVVFRHEGPAQKETGRQACEQILSISVDAVIATNTFLGQGVAECLFERPSPPIIGCFDEVPMMHLIPIPIASSVQDIPLLAESCVAQLLPQLSQGPAPQPLLLPAKVMTNPAFERRRQGR